MSNRVWIILAGAMVGGLLFLPFRFFSTYLLGRRGHALAMSPVQRVLLLVGLAVSGGVIAWRSGVSYQSLYLFQLLLISSCIFYIDATTRLIPNELVLAIFLLVAIFGFTGQIRFHIWSSLLGFVACFVAFFLPSLFQQKIGAGDVKLAAAMGFALGLVNSLYAIACMGGILLVYLVIEKCLLLPTSLKAMVPMGPFLAVALMIVSVL